MIEYNVREIRKLIEAGKLTIGAETTLKNLKLGNMSQIFTAKNTKSEVKSDLEYFANLSKVPLEVLDLPNTELGTTCKKPYSISVIGVLK